jgi:outer membrane receptor protein involved in Fe transport
MRALISTVAISTLVAIGSLAVMHMAIAAEPSGAESSGLEEIIVTATKRDTRLLDTPLSISVLSAGAIEKNRIVDVTDIEKAVPSFVFLHGSGSDNFLSIRGNSTVDDSSGTDQGVVMLVDDVARVSVADLQPQLYDLNRIEVLNGPQGTLFGRNALGGVIAIYTNNPSFKPEATAEVGFGSQNLAEVKGMVNVPLIQDRLALRVSATKETAGGYVRDITTGRDLGGHNLWTVLTKLLYTPSDDIRNVFGFDYLSRTGNQPTVLVGTFQPALYPTLPIHSNEDQTAQGNPGNIDQKIWGLTDRLDWKTGIGSVTSIAGYRHNDIDSLLSLTADPGNDYMFQQNEHDHQFTEELRLASPLEQRISWIAGLYFLDSYKSRPLSLGPLPTRNVLLVCPECTSTNVTAPLAQTAIRSPSGESNARPVGSRHCLSAKRPTTFRLPTSTAAISFAEATLTNNMPEPSAMANSKSPPIPIVPTTDRCFGSISTNSLLSPFTATNNPVFGSNVKASGS